MCLSTFLRRKVDTMLPGEQARYTREQLETLLEQHGTCDCNARGGAESSVHSTDPLAAAPGRGASTQTIAEHFKVSEATARHWCAIGYFGAPKALKLNGRHFEVPPETVRQIAEKRLKGWKFDGKDWVPPGEKRSRSTSERGPGENRDRGRSDRGSRENKSDASAQPKQRTLTRDYGGWENELDDA